MAWKEDEEFWEAMLPTTRYVPPLPSSPPPGGFARPPGEADLLTGMLPSLTPRPTDISAEYPPSQEAPPPSFEQRIIDQLSRIRKPPVPAYRAEELSILAREPLPEPEPVTPEPPGEIVRLEEYREPSQPDVLDDTGKLVPLSGPLKLEKYYTWLDPEKVTLPPEYEMMPPGVRQAETDRMRGEREKLLDSPWSAMGFDFGSEKDKKAKRQGLEKVRATELLGTPPGTWKEEDEETPRDFGKAWSPGILNPVVSWIAWGVNRENRDPEQFDSGVQRLIRVWPGQVDEKSVVQGVDLDQLRNLNPSGVLSMRQSIFLMALANRAKRDSLFLTALERPEVRAILAEAPGEREYDSTNPGETTREYKYASAWAMMKMADLKRSMDPRKTHRLGFDEYFSAETGPGGEFLPMTFAEDPEYWENLMARTPTHLLGGVISVAKRSNDTLLEGYARGTFEDRKPIPEADFWEGVSNIPQSAGRLAFGLAELYALLPLYLGAQAGWGVEYLLERNPSLFALDISAAGLEAVRAQAGTRWVNKQAKMQDFVHDRSIGIVKAIWHTIKAYPNIVGLDTMTDREWRQTKLVWEHDPLAPFIPIAIATGSFVKGSGAVLGATRAGEASVLAGIKSGWKVPERLAGTRSGWQAGGQAYSDFWNIRKWADAAGKSFGLLEAQTLGRLRRGGLKESVLGKEALNLRKDALASAKRLDETYPGLGTKLYGSALDAATMEAAGTTLNQSIGQIASVPFWGTFFKRWLYSPKTMLKELPSESVMHRLYALRKGEGWRYAVDLERRLEEGYWEMANNHGVPAAESRLAAQMMLEGLGDVGAAVRWEMLPEHSGMVAPWLKMPVTTPLKIGTYWEGTLGQAMKQAGETRPGPLTAEFLGERVTAALENAKVNIATPPDLGKMLGEIASREGIPVSQAAFQWLVYSMEASRPRSMALGPETLVDALEMGPKFVPTLAEVPASGGLDGSPISVAELAHRPIRAGTMGYKTVGIIPFAGLLPEITGVTPAAIRFSIALDYAMRTFPDYGPPIIGRTPGNLHNFATFYDHVTKTDVTKPNLFDAIPDAATKAQVALGMMRHLRPQLRPDAKAIKDLGNIRFLTEDGKTTEVSAFDVVEAMGKPVQDVGRFLYDTALVVTDAGLLSLGTLGEMGLKYFHRMPIKPKRLLRTLEEFAAEGKTDAERGMHETMVEKAKTAEPGTGGLDIRDMEASFLRGLGILGDAEALLKYRSIAREFPFRIDEAGVLKESGEVGRRLYQRMYDTSRAGRIEALTRVVQIKGYGEALQTLREQATTRGTVIDELMGYNPLSQSSVDFLNRRGLKTPDTPRTVLEDARKSLTPQDLVKRRAVALDIYREAEAVRLHPDTAAKLEKVTKQLGFTRLDTRMTGTKGTAVAEWQHNVWVSPSAAYFLEFFGGRHLPKPGWAAQLTQVIKANQIVYQAPTWVRDFVSNVIALGPMAGLLPGSRAWRLAGRIMETRSAFRERMEGHGLTRSITAETGMGGEAVAGGLRRQFGKGAADWWEATARTAKTERSVKWGIAGGAVGGIAGGVAGGAVGGIAGKVIGGAGGAALGAALGGIPKLTLDCIKFLGALTFNPKATEIGKAIGHQRGMTDGLARAALLSRETVMAAIKTGDVRWVEDLGHLSRSYGLPFSPQKLRVGGLQEYVLDTATRYGLAQVDKLVSVAGKTAYRDVRNPRDGRKPGSRKAALDASYAAQARIIEVLLDAPLSHLRTEVPPELSVPAALAEEISPLGIRADLPPTGTLDAYNTIINKVRRAFVDYEDPSRLMGNLVRNPFGPIYATFASQALPMAAKWFLNHPVKAMALKASYDMTNNLLWHLIEGEGSLHDMEKSVPWWQVPVPFKSDVNFDEGKMSKRPLPVGFDMAWFLPTQFALDSYHPFTSPAMSTLLEVSQMVHPSRTPPRAIFPLEERGGTVNVPGVSDIPGLKNVLGRVPGGPSLTDPNASLGMQLWQLAGSQFAKVTPGTGVPDLLKLFAAKAGYPTAPGATGVKASPTWQPVFDAWYGKDHGTYRMSKDSRGLELLRMLGFRLVPLGEDAAMGRHVIPVRDYRAETEARFGKEEAIPPSRMPFTWVGKTRDYIGGISNKPILIAKKELDRLEREQPRTATGNLVPASTHSEVALQRSRIVAADALRTHALARILATHKELQNATVFEWENTPSKDRWLKSGDLELMELRTREDVLNRLVEKVGEVLEGKKTSEGYSDEMSYIMEAYKDTVIGNMGSTPGLPGTRTAEEIWHIRRGAKGDKAKRKARLKGWEYDGQELDQPEAAIREEVRTRAEKATGNLLPGPAEPMQGMPKKPVERKRRR